MWIRPSSRRSCVAFAFTSLVLLAHSTRAQAPESHPTHLENEVKEMRTGNGAIREQLRKMQDQQDALLEVVSELQRRLNIQPAAAEQQTSPPAPSDSDVLLRRL
jgi:hypothetical protein